MKTQVDYYTRSSRDGDVYIVEEVKRYKHTLIPLGGNAIVTAYGGNGRFKFLLNNVEYITEFTKNICANPDINVEHTYYDYSAVQFNVDPSEEWNKIYPTKSGQYWVDAIYNTSGVYI